MKYSFFIYFFIYIYMHQNDVMCDAESSFSTGESTTVAVYLEFISTVRGQHLNVINHFLINLLAKSFDYRKILVGHSAC